MTADIVRIHPPGDEPPPPDWADEIPEHDTSPDPTPQEPAEGIVSLGHDRGVFFYLSRSAKQVFALKAAEHTRNSLMAMASTAHYWQRTQFFREKNATIDWEAATDSLMCQCRAVGIFDSDRLRGRGAWMDGDRAVLHVGDRLIVDGNPCGLVLPDSRFVYEAAKALLPDCAPPLQTSDAHALVEICQSLRWERGISGVLLAGFCAVAPICGGLAWRPSIWITGGAGSGKTWLKDNILAPAIGRIALQVQSKTSEAGIRQSLGSDARPVLFDEAEKEDAAAAVRMQGILDLVRQSSSEGGADIIKGSQNQSTAKRYRIRSCWAFCSINVAIEHHADETRITVLALRAANPAHAERDSEAFTALAARVGATITPEFSAGLLARSVRLLPIIRANAETFAQAVTIHLGNRRIGDQLGALLAGAYSLHSERIISAEQARDYVVRQDWQGAAEQDTERDEIRLLSFLTQYRTRITMGNTAPVECTVGRLVAAALGRDERINDDAAETELRQMGIRTDPGGILVSTSHPALKKLLFGTPWVSGWSRPLLRLPGAEAIHKATRFGFGHVSKCTFIPLAAMGETDYVQ